MRPNCGTFVSKLFRGKEHCSDEGLKLSEGMGLMTGLWPDDDTRVVVWQSSKQRIRCTHSQGGRGRKREGLLESNE